MKQQYCYHCMAPLGKSPVCGRCGADSRAAVPAAAYHLPCGTTLARRYVTGKVLGEGGFGITYIGMDTVLSKRVAVKEFYPAGIAARSCAAALTVTVAQEHARFFKNGVERFLFEAKSVAAFSDEEGIVNVQDYFQENNTAYIVMDYLDGDNLKEYVRRHGVLDTDVLIGLLMPVMRGLKAMHAKGIIHRDISPDNIMFTKKGQLKLTDFGSAKFYSGSERQKAVILKHGYAPEEQYRSHSEQGPYTDIYALCATIYTCITGKAPVPAPERVKQDTLQPPSQLGVNIRPSREKALMHGLAVAAKNRTPDMDTLMRELAIPGTSGAKPPQKPKPAAPATHKAPPASPNEYPDALKKKTKSVSFLPTKSFQRFVASSRRSRIFKAAVVVVPVLLVIALIVSAIYMAGLRETLNASAQPSSPAPSQVDIRELLSGIDSRPSGAAVPYPPTTAATEPIVPPAPLTLAQAQAHTAELEAYFHENAVHNDKDARYGDVIGLRKIYYAENRYDPQNSYIAFSYDNDARGYYKVLYVTADSFFVDNGVLKAHTTLMSIADGAETAGDALDNCWFLKDRFSKSGQFQVTTI